MEEKGWGEGEGDAADEVNTQPCLDVILFDRCEQVLQQSVGSRMGRKSSRGIGRTDGERCIESEGGANEERLHRGEADGTGDGRGHW